MIDQVEHNVRHLVSPIMLDCVGVKHSVAENRLRLLELAMPNDDKTVNWGDLRNIVLLSLKDMVARLESCPLGRME